MEPDEYMEEWEEAVGLADEELPPSHEILWISMDWREEETLVKRFMPVYDRLASDFGRELDVSRYEALVSEGFYAEAFEEVVKQVDELEDLEGLCGETVLISASAVSAQLLRDELSGEEEFERLASEAAGSAVGRLKDLGYMPDRSYRLVRNVYRAVVESEVAAPRYGEGESFLPLFSSKSGAYRERAIEEKDLLELEE